MEFLKGYLFGEYYECKEFILYRCQPTDDYRAGIVFDKHLSYPYKIVDTNQVRNYEFFADPYDLIDHHNYLCDEDYAVVADTPQEALRLYILKAQELEHRVPEVYIRVDNTFVGITEYANDKYYWDYMFENVDCFYIYALCYPYDDPDKREMQKFKILFKS